MTAPASHDLPLTVMRALGEPKRLRLFRALQAKERCVSDLVSEEELPQPLVSHHLGVLVRAGLVCARRQRGFTLYAVDPNGLEAARAAIDDLLDPRALDAVALPGGNLSCCREGAC